MAFKPQKLKDFRSMRAIHTLLKYGKESRAEPQGRRVKKMTENEIGTAIIPSASIICIRIDKARDKRQRKYTRKTRKDPKSKI